MISTAQNHVEHKATQTGACNGLHADAHNHRQTSICLMEMQSQINAETEENNLCEDDQCQITVSDMRRQFKATVANVTAGSLPCWTHKG